MYKRILVPLDGSTRAESAVPIAARIAQASGGSVILLQVAAIPIEIETDLVVMSSHGFTGFKRWALGSVAHKLAPHSSVPVLVLRDGGSVPTTQPQQPMRVFVPLDGSPLSESGLEPAAQLITALASTEQRVIHLMRVVDLLGP